MFMQMIAIFLEALRLVGGKQTLNSFYLLKITCVPTLDVSHFGYLSDKIHAAPGDVYRKYVEGKK